MPDDLDRAVDARIDAYRPDTVPAFEAIVARRTRRDRRRLAGGGAGLAVAAVITAAAVSLAGGPQAPDRLGPAGGMAAGVPAEAATFELLPDLGAAYGDLRSDPALRRCLALPGAVPQVDAALSLPALYYVHAQGSRAQNRELQRCLRALPDLTVTKRPGYVRPSEASSTFYVEPEGAAVAAAYTAAVERCLALPGVTGSSVQESDPAAYKLAGRGEDAKALEDCLQAVPGARVTAASGPAHDSRVPPAAPAPQVDAPVCQEGYECSGTGGEAVPRCAPGLADEPCGPGLQQGQPYRYLLQTHCGVKGLYADGREWVPAAGQNVGENGAPDGFGDPEDYGSVTLNGDQRLDYRSSSGVPLRFVPGEIPEDDCN